MIAVSRGRLLRRAAAALCGLALWAAASGCGARGPSKSAARLRNGAPSAQALAERVLRAIERQDLQALKDLSLSEEEFERHVWPELPASKPGTNLTAGFVWGDVYFRSMSRMQAIFGELKGRRLSLVRAVHRGDVEEYATHRAYPGMETVIRSEDGKEMEYTLFGTLIEMDGVWKVYSYGPYD